MELETPTDEGWEQHAISEDLPRSPYERSEPQVWEHPERGLRVTWYVDASPEFGGRPVFRATIAKSVDSERPTDTDIAFVRSQFGLEHADEAEGFDPLLRQLVQVVSSHDVPSPEPEEKTRAPSAVRAPWRQTARIVGIVLASIALIIGLAFWLNPCLGVSVRVMMASPGWKTMRTRMPTCQRSGSQCRCTWESANICVGDLEATSDGDDVYSKAARATDCGGMLFF